MTAAPAWAQSGGFAARPTGGRQISVKAVGTIEYNDNVVLNDPRISGGGSKGDAIASPSLDLNILLPRARGDAYLAGSIGYRFYKNYTRLNREYISLTGGADQQVASCLVHGEVNYGRSLIDLGDLYVADSPTSYTSTQETRVYSTDIGCGAPFGLRPALAYSRSETRNNLTQRQFADSDTDSVTAQLGTAVPAVGNVSVFGRMSDSRYIHRLTPTGGRDGLKSYAVGVQVERTVGTRLAFTGSLNYTKADPKLAGTRSFSGVGYSLSGQYRGDDYNIIIAGGRNVQPSVLYLVSYNVSTNISITANKELSRTIRVGAAANRTWRTFTGSTLYQDALVSGRDTNSSVSANLSYSGIRRVNLSLSGGYNERTTNTRLFRYRAKRIALTASLAL